MSKDTATPDTADFSQFLLSPTGRVEISLPNGEPMLYQGKQVTVHVFSPASAEYARAEAVLQRAARERLFGSKKKVNDAEEEAETNARFLVTVTSSIENFPYPGGPEAIYRERKLAYIADQVRAYLNDQGNFYKPSKAS